MILVVLPVLLYGLVHVLGRYFPARLWGADQLYYYPPVVTIFFILIVSTTLVLAAKSNWVLWADEALVRLLRSLQQAVPVSFWLKVGMVVFAVLFAYAFRDRSHHLGDSAKWFGVLDHALLGSTTMESIPAHHSHLDIAGFEYINYQQALDLFIHFQAYRLGHALWGWTSVDAYEWTSCLAGGFYVVVLYQLVFTLAMRTRDRLTLFAFLATLGLSQLFFGYGESYTLVTAGTALYVLYALRYLQGACSVFYPTLLLLLSAALHLLSLSLLPSWLYLLWRNQGRLASWYRRPLVYGPLLVVGGLAGAYAHAKFYSGLSLPLWQAAEAGKYAMLSIPHIANLANEILLLSPFGLLWGMVFLVGRRPFTPHCSFLALAAAGAGALIFVHYISMGGRDWDLMAFPGLFYSLWGFLCLGLSPCREAYFRQVRWTILPLMLMHTALWIGINNNSARAMDRVGNLLEYTPNQSLDYQYFVRGHYYLNMRQDNPEQAAAYLRQAIAHTPVDDVGTLRRYRKYLGQALVEHRDFAGAVAQFEQGFAGQKHPVILQSDMVFHTYWVTALIEGGLQHQQAGEAAEALWQEAIDHCQRILAIQPSASLFKLLGWGLEVIGRFDEAVAAYSRSIELERSAAGRASTYTYLAKSLQRSGDRQGAIEILKKSIHLDPDQPEMLYNLGNIYYTDGQFDLAAQAYKQAIERSGGNPQFHFNLARSLQAQGDLRGAERVYLRAVELGVNDVESFLALARLYLDTEQTEKALPVLRRVLESDFPGCSADVYTQVGIDLFALGDIDAATRAYRKALDAEGQNAVARINLGWCLYLLDDLPAAIETYRQVLAEQSSPQAQFNLALAYLARGDIAEAQAAYALGVEKYGAVKAMEIGAVGDLRELSSRGPQAAEAGAILRMYWGE